MTFKPEGFSEQIFKQRYALTSEETWEEACLRLAQQNAKAEQPEKQKEHEARVYQILVDNLWVPGGRVWANSGRSSPAMLNCFVLRHNLDSREGWADLAREMIITSMSGGGVGIDFSDVRPNGAAISSGGTSPGPVALMKLIDGCAAPVRAGGSRRAALLFGLNLRHPDIEEFLDAKLTKGQLTYANVSVQCDSTEDFIKAVRSDGDWELSWKGQYKKTIRARTLWSRIVKNAHTSAEPGFLNRELAERESNIGHIEKLVCPNPCGELFMSSYDCCCLGHLVLPRFVKDNDVDWHYLANTVRLGVRFLDNVLTVNSFPLPEMKAKSAALRRIGMGVTGLADMLAVLGHRYGSDEANKFVDKLFRFIMKTAYEASVMLAIEKGPFPAMGDRAKYLESGFAKRLPKKLRALIEEHGIRNCAILTMAPTGTVSILSGNCSSGLEPMFAPAYERRFFVKDKRQTELVFHPLFAEFMREGKPVDHFVSSHELSVREHMEVQKVIQKYVDNAISKTINMPESYTTEDMSDIWLEYLPYLKGTTFYRENTRGYVDENGVVHEPPLVALPLEEAKRRFSETATTEAAYVEDCVGGSCEVSFDKGPK